MSSGNPGAPAERRWQRWLDLAPRIAAWAAAVALAIFVVLPIFNRVDTWGGHDWDTMTTFRYFVRKALRVYGQFPFWNPYTCGGHDAWAYVEGGTNVVSPWLPFYLFGDVRIALRVEILGMAMLGAVGAYLLAGRFTKSPAARLFVAALLIANGRWALQIWAGHAWHLYYAWLPWTLWLFERAHGCAAPEGATESCWKNAAGAGVFLALMVYNGALYPLPHTAFLLCLYAALLALTHRSARPLYAVATAGVVGMGLAAPKLLPLLDTFARMPRHTASPETMGYRLLLDTLTSKTEVPAPPWGWHEWGMYVGWPIMAVLLVGIAATRGKRCYVLLGLGVLLLVIALGSFHPWAPWSLLHKLPVFRSQHVPSRWMVPALLLLGLAAAGGIERLLERTGTLRAVLEIAVLFLLGGFSLGMARVARLPLGGSFWLELPKAVEERSGEFHNEAEVPEELYYTQKDWAIPHLPSLLVNQGVVECYAVTQLSRFSASPTGEILGRGAIGKGDPRYRGEVFTESGVGVAKLVRFTPNEVVVDVQGAKPPDLLVLNQNFERGWTANGAPAMNRGERVAAQLRGDGEIRLRYRPRLLVPGLGLFTATLGVSAAAWLVERRRRRAFAPPSDARVTDDVALVQIAPIPPDHPATEGLKPQRGAGEKRAKGRGKSKR